MKKITAFLLAITLPIWLMPIFLLTFCAAGFITAYQAILEILEGKRNENSFRDY